MMSFGYVVDMSATVKTKVKEEHYRSHYEDETWERVQAYLELRIKEIGRLAAKVSDGSYCPLYLSFKVYDKRARGTVCSNLARLRFREHGDSWYKDGHGPFPQQL